MKKKFLGVVLAVVLAITTVTVASPQQTQVTAEAASKLKLNSQMAVGKTTKCNKKAKFIKAKYYKKNTVNAKCTYKVSKKEDLGSKYRVKVNAKIAYDEVKINKGANTNYITGNTVDPFVFFTVFDYDTQKCLEGDNDLGVKVNEKNAIKSLGYYGTQKYNDGGSLKANKGWKISFTVTYPKDADIVVAVGFINGVLEAGTDYFNGSAKYSTTALYKKGRKDHTVSYLRLH